MRNPIHKLFFGILSLPVYLLSYLIARSSNIWVFGAWFGNQFNDNTAYLFEYILHTEPNIKAVWLSRNNQIIHNLREKGYHVYHKNSIKGFWYGSRAGVTFINCGYDDVNKYCIKHSRIVQLWHGIPLKKIKNDDIINVNKKRSNATISIRSLLLKVLPFLDERYDLIISSSSNVTDLFVTAFQTSRTKIIETGYPRMDIITNPKFSYSKDKIYNKDSINKCILFAPTHRKEGEGNPNYFNCLDFDKFNRFLKGYKAKLLIKMHYYERDKKNIFPHDRYSHIKLIDNYEIADINRILPHIDLLITDYSSVFYDFLVLDRPIIFAPFDLDEYEGTDHELYMDYSSATPGPICHNWNQIKVQLEKYFSNGDIYKTERGKIFNQYFKYSDNNNSQRIIKTVKDYINTSN